MHLNRLKFFTKRLNVTYKYTSLAHALGATGICLLFSSATSAMAQSQASTELSDPVVPAASLSAVTVTGSRASQSISETAHTIYVVDEAEIQSRARAGETLQQILASHVPSLDPASSAARTSYGQNLRGRTALVLIDGVSMNSARGLSRQFDAIDPFNVERVEVLSGGSALYGGNATGGIIHIITKKGRDAESGWHGEMTAGMGSGFQSGKDWDRNVAGALTYRSDVWDARLAVAASRNGAFYDGNGTPLVPDITQSSTAFNQRLDVSANVGLQIDSDRRLELGLQNYESEQDSDYGLYYGANLAALSNPALFATRDGYQSDFNPRTRRSMVRLGYTDRDLAGQELQLEAFYRTENIRFHPFPYSSYFGGSTQVTDYYGMKATLVARPIKGLKITYGLDADKDSFSSSQNIFDMATILRTGGMEFVTSGVIGLYPKIDVNTVAGFAEASYEASDRLTLSAGLRYQYANTSVSDFVGAAQQLRILQGTASSADVIPGGSVDYGNWLASAGATYRLTSSQQVYANFSQSFELPDPAKYYGVGVYQLQGTHLALLNGTNVGNSALRAIRSDSIEAGYRLDDGTYRLNMAGYYSRSNRSMALNSQTLAIEMRDQSRRVYGWEASAGMRMDKGFDVGGQVHLVRSELSSSTGWTKESVGTASVSKLGAHLGWRARDLRLRLAAQRTNSLSDDAGGYIEGYTLWDLTGSYVVRSVDATVDFGVYNLLDKSYTTLWGARAKALYGALASPSIFDYRGRGRSFGVSITKMF